MVYREVRKSLTPACGEPVSHTSVGSVMSSWSIVPALAMTGTPRSAAAAAPMNAFLDVDSAFKAVVRGAEVAGTKAETEPRVISVSRIESFVCWLKSHYEKIDEIKENETLID